METKRAFIGPLGDDIPSIFPIVIGILLFVGAMLFAGNLVDQKNAFLSLRKATVNLAYSLTERGYYDKPSFDEKCAVLESQAKAAQVFFAVSLKNYCSGSIDFLELSRDTGPGGTGVLLMDVSKPDPANPGLKCWIGGSQREQEPKSIPKDAVVLNYPVGIECKSNPPHRGLGLMNLVVWKQLPGRRVLT
jgi:hypothetical protein